MRRYPHTFARYLERNGKGTTTAFAALRAPKSPRRLPKPLTADAARRVVAGTDVNHWWDNGANAIAFSRGDKGFVAINREATPVSGEAEGSIRPVNRTSTA